MNQSAVEGRMHWLRCASAVTLAILAACTVESTTSPPASPPPEDPSADGGDGEPTEEDAGARGDAGKPSRDGAADAASKPAWTAGESGKSCAAACKAVGKTCVVACTDHRSCGGHDGVAPPYAGYACYYSETKSGGGSFRTNKGRSLKSCDDVATATWDYYGTEYDLGDYIGGNPVSCCCQ